MTKKQIIHNLRDAGFSYREIERQTGIPRSLIAYHCNGTTKAAAQSYQNTTRAEINRILTEYKVEKGCKLCSESHPATLDFHHVDGKDFTIASYRQKTVDIAVIMSEIAKCEVLCSNCHRKEHWKR